MSFSRGQRLQSGIYICSLAHDVCHAVEGLFYDTLPDDAPVLAPVRAKDGFPVYTGALHALWWLAVVCQLKNSLISVPKAFDDPRPRLASVSQFAAL